MVQRQTIPTARTGHGNHCIADAEGSQVKSSRNSLTCNENGIIARNGGRTLTRAKTTTKPSLSRHRGRVLVALKARTCESEPFLHYACRRQRNSRFGRHARHGRAASRRRASSHHLPAPLRRPSMRSIFVPAAFLLLLIQAGLALADDKPSTAELPIAPGPFQPTMDSLKQYKCPDWFRDAKFGIWAHWGPQAVPMDGDWYARGIYEQGSKHYKYHLEHYGHPSQFGYKDIIPLWKAEKWDPDRLMQLYKKAGAKLFRQHGLAPRRLLPLELQAAQVERREHGPQARRGRRLAEGGQEIRPAVRRLRAPRRQLLLVPSQPRVRQDGTEGRRALRRGQPRIPGPLPFPRQARRQRLVQQRSPLAPAMVRRDQGTGRQLSSRPAL